MSNTDWPALRQHCAAAGATPAAEPALLPCPFCGSSAFIQCEDYKHPKYPPRYWGQCNDDTGSCGIDHGPIRATEAAAAADWNRRVNPEAATLRQQLADEQAAHEFTRADLAVEREARAMWFVAHERLATELAAVERSRRTWRDEATQATNALADERAAHEATRQELKAEYQNVGVLCKRLAAVRDLINSAECYLPGPLFAELIAALGGEGR